ncbi:hypothetical protein [Aquicoccus sp.]|uniref:hypothetical protein n=1 Tax=Aquicoccus sp. TaxID=2055851 RepID=UPI003567BF57
MTYPIPGGFRQSGRLVRRVNALPIGRFQVLGERASATNLVRKLIEKNLRIRRSEALGWKHAVPHMVAIPADFLTIVVVRHAESWALSMFKRPWHADPAIQALDLSAFLRAEWRGVVDRLGDFAEIPPEIAKDVRNRELQFDRHPLTGAPFPNLFALRRVKLAAMLGMLNRDCNVMLLRAEEVQADPEGFVTWASDALALARKSDTFQGATRRMGTRFRRAVPFEKAPTRLDAADRAFMTGALDLALESALGYDYSPD